MKSFRSTACLVGLAMLQFASQALSQAMPMNTAPAIAEPLQVFAAGSLRPAFTQIAKDYEAQTSQKVQLTFGASGLLRERIEKGEGAEVFASADTEHPQRLASLGAWMPQKVFARNALCALTSAQMQATPENLLATMLAPTTRLATSTPKADPSGDYAWALFAKAESLQRGAQATLEAKALKLTGAADSPRPPGQRNAYAWLMDEDKADIFLTYCTNAVLAQAEVPRLKVVSIPPALQVATAYGMTVKQSNQAANQARAQKFADYLLSVPAQAVLAKLGFGAP
jgi:molybdate transport system substrate-binding protein